MSSQIMLSIGAISAGLSVIIGAFGAHALKAVLSETSRATFETAVQYQMTHSLALLLVGLLMLVLEPKPIFFWAGAGFLLGICLFSGSLYGLAIWNLRWLGPVTPIGGVLFIAGWLALAYGAFSSAVPGIDRPLP